MTVHKSRSAHVLSKERTNREVYRLAQGSSEKSEPHHSQVGSEGHGQGSS